MENNMVNRPVTAADIAARLNMNVRTVRDYIKNSKGIKSEKVQIVQKTAAEMGYDARAIHAYNGRMNTGRVLERRYTVNCIMCGEEVHTASAKTKYCPVCLKKVRREQVRCSKIEHGWIAKFWYNGNFRTKEEETERMIALRNEGYSNTEIGKRVGRHAKTVLRRIGCQDAELSRQNVAMAQHIRAQKNAARRQYVVNKPIREHNARVEAANKKKAELLAMQAELTAMQENIKAEQPAIEQAAQTTIDFPMFDLHTVQPTALQ